MKICNDEPKRAGRSPHRALASTGRGVAASLQPPTGHGRYVFPGERSHDRPLSDNSVRSGLYALGFGKEQTWHGFRGNGAHDAGGPTDLDPLAIEANLAHAVKDANGRSYNRTQNRNALNRFSNGPTIWTN